MRYLILLGALLLSPGAAAQDEITEGLACVANSVSNDTATRVYVWWTEGQDTSPPEIATAVGQAIADCNMVPVLQPLPKEERLRIMTEMLALIARRGEGLTV